MDYWRGHRIEETESGWIYSDTRQLVSENKDRSCGLCGHGNTKKGHDYCIQNLRGVVNACCGHGDDNQAYIQFKNGLKVFGKDAMKTVNLSRSLKDLA